MSSIIIKEGQTGIDLANQLYANLDNISTLYLANDEFDINQMQDQSIINYELSKDQLNQNINEIRNNEYQFINQDAPVYSLYSSNTYNVGVISLSGYSEYYGSSYYVNNDTKDIQYLISGTSVINIYNDGTIIDIYKENFN